VTQCLILVVKGDMNQKRLKTTGLYRQDYRLLDNKINSADYISVAQKQH